MLTLHTGSRSRDCAGLTRRDFVRAGLLGLGGLSLPWLLRTRASAAEATEPAFVKDRAIVLVFLAGGASHIETFNPNMNGPEESRSITGAVQTTLPGVTFGGTFPQLAKHAHEAILVRSFRHPIGNHEQAISHVLTGGTDVDGQAKDGHSMGSIFARLRGANHPKHGLPTYAVLPSPHKDNQYANEMKRVLVGSRAGSLGAAYEPFVPTGGGTALSNLTLRLPAERLEDRRDLLKQLDGLKRGLDERDTAGSHDQFERQALELLTHGAGEAFDLTKEKPDVVERYDTSSFKVGKKVFEPSTLGKQMLLARRLVEAGAGFVTVQSAGWDMHADGNNPGVKDGMEMLGRPLDRGLSVFLDDVRERGLLDRVLLILTGDFGRTPKINKNGGRDHYPNLCTLALFGGGLKTGQVVGQSDRNNAAPVGEPLSTPNLLSTVLHYLFDVGTLRVTRGIPTNLVRLAESHRPLPGVL
jgi:uncharacterized protein (DUF1501 family)